jgi:penicillin amidase
MGHNIDDWKWGELHTLTFYHPFGKSSPLMGYFMNIGPFPMGGSMATVNPQPYRLSNPWEVYHGASLRYIIDFSNMNNSLRVIPAGISGNFMSPHYDDQTEMWRTGKYRPFVLDRKSVEEDVRYTLTMLPD